MHLCTIVPISQAVGANRIVPGVAIPFPLGNPDKTAEQEKAIRRQLVDKALKALQTPIEEQRLFE